MYPRPKVQLLIASALLLVTGAVQAAQPAAKPAATPAASSAARPTAKAPVKAATAPVLPAMAAQQVVDKYLAARGGAAWKQVNTLTFKGKMGAGGTTYEAVTDKLTLERKERPEMLLPFVLETKRPNKSRWEIDFNGQTAVQVFDGKAGFKYRPFLNRSDWEPFSAAELKSAQAQPGLEGWLESAIAAGARVESDGSELVADQPCYRLKVTGKDGKTRHVWIDGKTFLEAREDGEPRKLDGREHAVSVLMSNYHAVNGLQLPFTIETVVQGVPKPETMTIESVTVNPSLDDTRFAKPK